MFINSNHRVKANIDYYSLGGTSVATQGTSTRSRPKYLVANDWQEAHWPKPCTLEVSYDLK